MKIINPEEWKASSNIILENAAEKSIFSEENILVIAGPGSGKTELLAQKANYLLSTNQCRYPQKILAISFKKDAAANLKKRVLEASEQEYSYRFISQTYDAFAKEMLDHFRLALPEGNIPEKNYIINDKTIIKNVFECVGYSNLKWSQCEYILNNTSLPLRGNGKDVQAWKLLLNGFEDNSACLTFGMITKLTTLLFKSNKKLREVLNATYSYVFLDEFQDTTSLQYELLKACFKDSGCNTTAVGDPKQRIMLWAGARKTIFEDYINDFNSQTKRLTMNFRSAPKLIGLQKKMNTLLNGVETKTDYPIKWDDSDGEINLLLFDNSRQEAKCIAEDIQYKLKRFEPREICILCKQNIEDYTQNLIDELRILGIRARYEAKYQDLNGEPLVLLIMSILQLSIDIRNPSAWEYISDEFVKYNSTAEREDNSKLYFDFWDSIEFLIKNIHDKVTPIKCDADNLLNIISSILKFIGKDKLASVYPIYKQENKLQKILKDFYKIFLKELNIAHGNWQKAIDGFNGLNSIPVMTVHKSKGLEYSAVYFIGLEDSAFWNFKKATDEARSILFVAMSRAKESLTFTFSNERPEVTGSIMNRVVEQSKQVISEFYELLENSEYVEVKDKRIIFKENV